MKELDLSGLIYENDEGGIFLNIYHSRNGKVINTYGDYIIKGPSMYIKIIYFNDLKRLTPRNFIFSVPSEKLYTLISKNMNRTRILKLNLHSEFNDTNNFELIFDFAPSDNKYILKIKPTNKDTNSSIFIKTFDNNIFVELIKEMCKESIIRKEINYINKW